MYTYIVIIQLALLKSLCPHLSHVMYIDFEVLRAQVEDLCAHIIMNLYIHLIISP